MKPTLTSRLKPLSISLLLAPGFALGCAEPGVCEPPARTAVEPSEEMIGVSANRPVRRAAPEFDDADSDAVRVFHDALAPYGAWTDDARLGLVWIPSRDRLDAPFVPYVTHGRWTHREVVVATGRAPHHEYVWVSDLPWGWVTFHYGRWAFAGDHGWAWVAGRKYAGAWVDWRAPQRAAVGATDGIIGWGPTPPAHVWRLSPGPTATRARLDPPLDVREARLVPTPYAAFATPYTYVRARDLFSPEVAAKSLPVPSALMAATDPAMPPNPGALGFRSDEVPAPPAMDLGLQRAWLLATPATAIAIGAGPELGPPPRLRTWVAGGYRYSVMR